MLDNKPRIMYIEFLLQRFRIHQLLKFDQPIPVVNCEKSDSGKNVQPYAQVFRAQWPFGCVGNKKPLLNHL